ncbi:hypothetical protein [Georgenia sp. SUBG003]|uniref:hypothetical protein n=1 Tax=Georgenia sp. SUBG003 TaxID=1497974 RepID=UPI003AB14F9C
MLLSMGPRVLVWRVVRGRLRAGVAMVPEDARPARPPPRSGTSLIRTPAVRLRWASDVADH